MSCEQIIPDYYFNTNNCYNRTSVHIIKNCNFELPRDTRLTNLTSQGGKYYSKVWNLKYDEDIPLKMYGVVLLSRSTRVPNFIYKMCVCKLN